MLIIIVVFKLLVVLANFPQAHNWLPQNIMSYSLYSHKFNKLMNVNIEFD